MRLLSKIDDERLKELVESELATGRMRITEAGCRRLQALIASGVPLRPEDRIAIGLADNVLEDRVSAETREIERLQGKRALDIDLSDTEEARLTRLIAARERAKR